MPDRLLLEARGLVKRHRSGATPLRGLDLRVERGEAVGLVGASGSGKTTLARLLVGLDRPDAGTVRVAGVDVHRATGADRRGLSRRVQLVFQNPDGTLNPRMRVGDAIDEVLRVHGLGTSPRERRLRVGELLETVGLRAEDGLRLPGRFSGGQRQRIALARALAVEPQLLVLDEPVASLDVSVQAQVANRLVEIREGRELALLVISHDEPLVRHLCRRVERVKDGRLIAADGEEAGRESPPR